MLDRMYKEYPKGSAPAAMETLAQKIRAADAFVFVAGEYNWGPQPGLKNLTDHFLEEWFWRPGGDRQLFVDTNGWITVERDLAQHSFGNGDGRDFQLDHRRSHPEDD